MAASKLPSHQPNTGPEVVVYRSLGYQNVIAAGRKDGPGVSGDTYSCDGDSLLRRCNLVYVDVASRSSRVLVENEPISWFGIAPDGLHIAYTVHKGWEQGRQQPRHDLFVLDVGSGNSRSLLTDAYLHIGDPIRWSTRGKRLAYLMQNPGEVPVLGIEVLENRERITIRDARIRSFNSDAADSDPILFWDDADRYIYGLHANDGSLWRVHVSSRRLDELPIDPLRRITGIEHVGLKDDSQQQVVLTTESPARTNAKILRVSLGKGRTIVSVEKKWNIHPHFESSRDGTVSFIASDQLGPPRLWLLDRKNNIAAVPSRGADLSGFPLGTAEVVNWPAPAGQIVRGSLLLPPFYKSGQRLPLVVWVYGGDNGSEHVNQWGLAPGNAPVFNLQVLATRGYAVLFPDSSLPTGEPMRELRATVMRAIDAAIEHGYADPERIAVMGQSYGSYCVMSLVAHSNRFKAAVLTGTMAPDLLRMYLHMERDGTSSEAYFERGQGRMGGTPWQFPGNYIAESPVYRFDRIVTPVLIGKGDRDGPLAFSDSVFVALRRLAKPVEYRVYLGEGHVISGRGNVIDFWQRRLEFLAASLGLDVDDNGIVTVPRGPSISGDSTEARSCPQLGAVACPGSEPDFYPH